MSIAATNWACRQRTGCPQAKCILQAIADEADSSGHAVVAASWLAVVTEQSEDSVRRWLKVLEDERKLLTRFNRPGKESEFRLAMGEAGVPRERLLGQEPDAPDAQEIDAESGNAPESTPRNLQGVAPPAPPAICKGSHPPQSAGGTSSSGDSPPISPPRGGGGPDSRSGEKEPPGAVDEASLLAFKAAYPCATTQPARLAQLWAALEPGERAEAALGAAGYGAECARLKRKPKDPVRFIRDRLWPEFVRFAPKPPAEKHFVAEGSPAWAAWAVFLAIREPEPTGLRAAAGPDGRQGAWFARPLPPGGVGLAEFAGPDGLPDLDAWVLIEEGCPQWWAWNERAQRWTGKPLKEALIATGETHQARTLKGDTFAAPVRVKGRWLPCEWPPALGAERKRVEETEDA